jgi:hypothetical protein
VCVVDANLQWSVEFVCVVDASLLVERVVCVRCGC